jgi:hypothetical protein
MFPQIQSMRRSLDLGLGNDACDAEADLGRRPQRNKRILNSDQLSPETLNLAQRQHVARAPEAQVLGGAALPEHLNAAAKAEVIAAFHRINGPGEIRQCCIFSGLLSRANHNDLGDH